ncbi:hypothetical protein EKO27_g5464 [Xylaria grammica]|uniref:Uncharacterized protein n=1 Tax=Xylaria grammica TaxID=363999 RepID=A0A439D5H3_9PEZI|nr:hypothetical protein EKO27_g5464 [Xylaria grammica]
MSGAQQQGAHPAAGAGEASAPASFSNGVEQPYTPIFTHDATTPTAFAMTTTTGPYTTVTMLEPHISIVTTPTHIVTTTTNTAVTRTITIVTTPQPTPTPAPAPAPAPASTIPSPPSTRPPSGVGTPTTTDKKPREPSSQQANAPSTPPDPGHWMSSANRPPFLGGMGSPDAWVSPYSPYSPGLRHAPIGSSDPGSDSRNSNSGSETAPLCRVQPVLGGLPKWPGLKDWHKGLQGRWMRGSGSGSGADYDDEEVEETGRRGPRDRRNGSGRSRSGQNSLAEAIEEHRRRRLEVHYWGADEGRLTPAKLHALQLARSVSDI